MPYENLLQLRKIDRNALRHLATEILDETSVAVQKRGKEYYRGGRVLAVALDLDAVMGAVRGTRLYNPYLEFRTMDSFCDCPADWPCKHLVALSLYILHELSNAEESLPGLYSPEAPKKLPISNKMQNKEKEKEKAQVGLGIGFDVLDQRISFLKMGQENTDPSLDLEFYPEHQRLWEEISKNKNRNVMLDNVCASLEKIEGISPPVVLLQIRNTEIGKELKYMGKKTVQFRLELEQSWEEVPTFRIFSFIEMPEGEVGINYFNNAYCIHETETDQDELYLLTVPQEGLSWVYGISEFGYFDILRQRPILERLGVSGLEKLDEVYAKGPTIRISFLPSESQEEMEIQGNVEVVYGKEKKRHCTQPDQRKK